MSDSDESRDEARPDAAQVDHAEPSADAETEFRPFDDIADEFQPGPDQHVIGPDGLPLTVDKTQESDIPSLSTKTLVCMGDFSMFVVRDQWREPLWWFSPNDVERAPNGQWRISEESLIARGTDRLEKLRQKLFPHLSAKDIADTEMLARDLDDHGLSLVDGWLLVEPLRPPCKHYVRQKTSFELNAQHKAFLRLCSARRTTEGTFMTVRDTGIWACDMRDPYDRESAAELDAFDAMKIEQGKNVQRLPMFGGPGGIFDSSTQGK